MDRRRLGIERRLLLPIAERRHEPAANVAATRNGGQELNGIQQPQLVQGLQYSQGKGRAANTSTRKGEPDLGRIRFQILGSSQSLDDLAFRLSDIGEVVQFGIRSHAPAPLRGKIGIPEGWAPIEDPILLPWGQFDQTARTPSQNRCQLSAPKPPGTAPPRSPPCIPLRTP